MDPMTVEALKEALDEFLDNPEDKDLEEEYLEVLKERTVYSFLSILQRIKYNRIFELIKVTNNIVRDYNSKSNEIDTSSSESESTLESTSDESSEETESNSEDEQPKNRMGTAFDLLMDEEC